MMGERKTAVHREGDVVRQKERHRQREMYNRAEMARQNRSQQLQEWRK